MLHPPAKSNCKSLSPGRGVAHNQPVICWNPNQRYTAAIPGHIHGLLNGLVRPCGLNDDIHPSPVGRLHHCRNRIGIGTIDNAASKSFRKVKTPLQPVGDEYLHRARKQHRLENQESNRAGAQNRHTVTTLHMGEIRCVQRNSQRLQQHSAGIVDAVRKRETLVCGHVHTLTVTAIMREKSAELQMQAEVRISPLALFTPAARLCRIHRNAHSRGKRAPRPIHGFGTYPEHFCGKLMSKHDWMGHGRVPDSPILICVKIAAADPGGGNAYQCFSPARLGRFRHVVDAQVTRAVKPDGDHVLSRFFLVSGSTLSLHT